MSVVAGTRIRHYEILSRLGAGGMGEVYLAEDTLLSRKVAIKLLPSEYVADERARKRLMREARAAATLDHPNICAIYEVGQEDGLSFIVLQYIEGETLASRLKRQPVTVQEALSISSQVADALSEAHARNIIHRDIKPDNIMLTTRGMVKVLDFGLAKITREHGLGDSEAETASMLSVPGTVLGTVPYMSPEQVRGEDLDGRSDIFSFGSVVYEMLAGRRPFEARSSAEIISAILTVDPPPIAKQKAAIVLDQFVRKCLEKDPPRRFASMSDLVLDLKGIQRACESGEILPTGETTTVRLETLNKNSVASQGKLNRLRLALIVGAVALTLSAAVYALSFRSRSPAASPPDKSVNAVAYDYYLRGKVKVNSENPDSNEEAITLLEQAVAADPNLAIAYAELARAYNVKSFYFDPSARKQLNEDAEVAVEKALALNPDLAEAHYARGLILWTPAKGFPHEMAIRSYRRAIALNPNLDDAHHQLASVYLHIGLLDEALQELDKALALNPNNTMARFRVGVVNLYKTNFEDALAIFKGIPRDSKQTNPVLLDRTLATALFELGRTDESAAVVEDFLKTYPSDEGGTVTSVKAMLLARAGKEQEAEALIQRAIEIGKGFGHFHHTSYNIASAYALMNKPEPAIKWLQTAADDGFPCYPLFEKDPSLKRIRANPQFGALMLMMKERWEKYKALVKH